MASPDPGPVLSSHRGITSAPVEQVRSALFAIPTGRLTAAEIPMIASAWFDEGVMVSGGPDTFQAELGYLKLTIEMNRAADWIQAHGEWWWCGRFQVSQHPEGTLIVQRTYNIAKLGRWVVPLTVGRRHRENGRRGVLNLLQQLDRRLGSQSRILPD